jgi:hypothetical protein
MLLKQHIHACPFALVRQQLGNTTTNFSVSQRLCHLVHSTVSNATLCYDFPNHQSSVMSISTFCLLHFMVAVLG